MVSLVSVIGLNKIGLVQPHDDISKLIVDAAKAEEIELSDFDVVVVSQKIISKSEGQLVDILTLKPSNRAKSIAKRTKKDPRVIELILRDSKEVMKADREALVVRRKDGLICLNAGVDKSNVDGDTVYARLPKNPDKSAVKIKNGIEGLTGKEVAVIVADTYSRPHRVGQVEFTIGLAGLEPIIDYRGRKDLFGYQLHYKYVGFADEIAAAAELVMGQGVERTPVAIIRGLSRMKRASGTGLSKKLLLGKKRDIFHSS
ncbi:MAG TPA: coenzyme F420-0:L-glutamate ligase [Candidatus Bathyarchaeia archaeon]|nr:coenzyme F420-0:L-glutamate ligase [Candidatus Bathyarchaeia archaeon]